MGYRPAHARQASGEACATEGREDAGRRETGGGDDRNGAERGGDGANDRASAVKRVAGERGFVTRRGATATRPRRAWSRGGTPPRARAGPGAPPRTGRTRTGSPSPCRPPSRGGDRGREPRDGDRGNEHLLRVGLGHIASAVSTPRESFACWVPRRALRRRRTRLVASRPAFDRLGHFRPSIDESARVDSKPLVGRSVSMKSATPAVTASASRAAPHSPRARDLPEQVRPRAAPPRARDAHAPPRAPNAPRRTPDALARRRARVARGPGARLGARRYGPLRASNGAARRGAMRPRGRDARERARGVFVSFVARRSLPRRRDAPRRLARAPRASAKRERHARLVGPTHPRHQSTRAHHPPLPRLAPRRSRHDRRIGQRVPSRGGRSTRSRSPRCTSSRRCAPPFPRATPRRDDPPLQLSPRGRG